MNTFDNINVNGCVKVAVAGLWLTGQHVRVWWRLSLRRVGVASTVARTSEWQSYRWLVIIVKWFTGLTFSCLPTRFECLRSNWRQVYLNLNLWALCWQDLILVYECFHFGQWPLIVILRWHGPGLADWHCVRSKVPLCAWWPLNPGDQTEGCPHLVGSSWSWYHLICSCHIEIF